MTDKDRSALVRELRRNAGHTQQQAAACARLKLRYWQEVEAGQKPIRDGYLELYMRKTGQWLKYGGPHLLDGDDSHGNAA